MKLFALVSIIALTAATGAFAQSAPPMANQNPNNCTDGLRDCNGSSVDGTSKTPANSASATQNMTKTQQSEMPAGKPVGIQGGTACAVGQVDCKPAATDSKRGSDSGSASRGAPGNN